MRESRHTGIFLLSILLAALLAWNLYRAEVEPKAPEAPAINLPGDAHEQATTTANPTDAPPGQQERQSTTP